MLCKKAIQYIIHFSLFLYPSCPQDSIFLWCILSSNKTNGLRNKHFALLPPLRTDHDRTRIERKIKDDIFLNSWYWRSLFTQSKIYSSVSFGPIRSVSVRFRWMVRNVSQSGRKKHHKMWNNWETVYILYFFSAAPMSVCVCRRFMSDMPYYV